MQPNRGLELGRPSGSPLLVHASWLPAGALMSAHLALSAYGDRGLASAILLGVITACAYLVCVVVHTVAHRVCAGVVGTKLARSTVSVFGDVTEPAALSSTSGKEVSVALTGPVASLVLGGAAIAYSTIASGDIADVAKVLAAANLALGVLNLVPALPLDGGRLLAARSRPRARLASFAGKVIGLLAVAGGVWLLVRGPEFLTETALGLWLVLIGIFVFFGSGWSAYRTTALPELDGHTVGDWARPFAGRIDASAPAPAGGGPYAVSDRGRLAGILTESSLREGKRASELMVPWAADLGMPADAPLRGALQRLSEKRSPFVVVLDAKGVVRGVLDEGAVRARLARS